MSAPDSLKFGARLRIPCRRCGKHWLTVLIEEGQHRFSCPSCGASTEVTVKWDEGQLRVWTRDLP